ncbi:MAG TPA: hypothetical protein VED41_00180 [Solirubrobacteraceae bacterium]|nr:hypothetical protein [Solirubrobacteraceae bacterium]
MRNPFTHRFHADASEVIDREQELALLARRMAEGGRVRLAAPRGYGKTTLAEAALTQARADGALAVRVDLYGVTSRMTLCTRIEEAFERELSGASGAWTKAKAKLARRGGGMQLPAGLGGAQLGPEDAERRLLDALDLPGQLAAAGAVVVCYDEFQEVLRAGGAERDRRGRPRPGGLDAVIRSVTQRHGSSVGYLFCGSLPTLLGELFEHPDSPFYRQADPMALAPLPRAALGGYIETRFAASNRDVAEALEPLLDLACGHPRAAMILAHALWEELPENRAADAASWERALARLPDYVTEEEMRARWDALTPIQQKVAEVVARREGSPFSVAVLARYGETKDAVQGAVEALERDAVLMREHGRPFRGALTDPLFELWIAAGRHWPR